MQNTHVQFKSELADEGSNHRRECKDIFLGLYKEFSKFLGRLDSSLF